MAFAPYLKTSEATSNNEGTFSSSLASDILELAQKSANKIADTSSATTLSEKILKFPSDIDTDPYKLNKSVVLYIIKGQSWKNIEDALNSQTTAKIAQGFSEAANDITSIDWSGGLVSSAIKVATKGVDAGISFLSGLKGAINDTKQVNNLNGLKPTNFGVDDFEAVIRLPIPNNLMDIDNHTYTDGRFEDAPLIGDAVKGYKEFMSGLDSTFQTLSRNRNSTPTPQMPVVNPFLWQRYDGSNLKTFGFVFFMVPRNQTEAINMMRIVYLVKKYSYPRGINLTHSTDKNKFIESGLMVPPSKVLIQFQNPVLQKLINPGVCVIESITSTYNEGNTVGMTGDGIPRFIELNLTLKEYNQKFQSDF